MKFKPTHEIDINGRMVRVQLLHETTLRQGATVQWPAVCYICAKGEVTTRHKSEFERLFTPMK